jgi:lysozyme
VGLSDGEIDHLLHNDIERAAADIEREMPWATRLDPVRFRVLVNMAFNMGMGRLNTFQHFLQALEAGRYELAAAEMLHSKWAAQVGPRAERLEKMMRTGVADAE